MFALCSSFFLLLVSSPCGVTYSQTDWSGGYGAEGPLSSWGDWYDTAPGIDFCSEPGSVRLGRVVNWICVSTAEDEYGNCVDLDGDGDVDILVTGRYDKDLCWIENLGGGENWDRHSIEDDVYNPRRASTCDIDSDGDLDVLMCAYSMLRLYINDDLEWTGHVIDPWVNGAREMAAGDIDLDGDPDIVSCSHSTYDYLSWWENLDGSGLGWEEHVIFPLVLQPLYPDLADIEGDGDLDVFLASGYTDSVLCFLNPYPDTGLEWSHIGIDSVYRIDGLQVSDVDQDSDVDLFVHSAEHGPGWLEQITPAEWTLHFLETEVDYSMTVLDIDGDGDDDIYANGSYRLAWFENRVAEENAFVEHVFAEWMRSRYIEAGDMDGNGMADAVALSYWGQGMSGIFWMDPTDPARHDSVMLTSTILDTGSFDKTWMEVDWTSVTPPGTDLVCQVRTERFLYPLVMDDWSDTVYSPGNIYGLLEPDTRYFQYRFLLRSEDSTVTPVLEDFLVTAHVTGISGEESSPMAFEVTGPRPNPVSGPASIYCTACEATTVDLMLYDAAGRLVARDRGVPVGPGRTCVTLPEMPPGVYMLRVGRGRGFDRTLRFVVVAGS